MRDALSLLDQAIAHGGGKRRRRQACARCWARSTQSYLLRLLEAVAARRRAARWLAIADEMQARSLSFDAALAGPGRPAAAAWRSRRPCPTRWRTTLPERERIVALARRLDPETVQLYYQIALQGREDLPLAPDEHAGFVMTLLRMLAFRPETAPATQTTGGGAVAAPQAKPPAAGAPGPRRSKATGRSWCSSCRSPGRRASWRATPTCRATRTACFELVVPKSMGHLAERSYQDKLQGGARAAFRQAAVRVQGVGRRGGAARRAAVEDAEDRDARRAEAARAVQGDGFVQDLVNLFDGKVVDSSVRERRQD